MLDYVASAKIQGLNIQRLALLEKFSVVKGWPDEVIELLLAAQDPGDEPGN